MRRAAILPLVVVLAACASARKDDDVALPPVPPAQQQEIAELQSKLAETQKSMTELLERIDVLNERIAGLEQAAVRPAASAPASRPAADAPPQPAAPTAARAMPPRPSSLASADIADAYREALTLFAKGQNEEARRAFQHVFDADRAGDLADNALYWIGETYFAAANYNEALKYYRRVSTEYAESNKAPDALFKTAVTYEKLGDLGVAKNTLDEVIRRYPYSAPAAAAKLELKRIKY